VKIKFKFILTIAVLSCLIAACSNAKQQISNTGQTDGVTSNQITIGGLASLTGPLTADFAPIFTGVSAYIDRINAEGGVWGRKIKFAYQLDDASDPSQDVDQARNLVSTFKVFAVVGVATPSFEGASYLADNGVPVFGMAINPGWWPAKNMFGVGGSYVDFTGPQNEVAYLAEMTHSTKVAVLAYNIAESSQGCTGAIAGLKEYGIDVAYTDLGIPAPAVDLSADVAKIAASGANMVVSCMDLSGNLLLSQDIHQQGLHVTQYWYDGYDPSVLNNPTDSNLMNSVYFSLQNAPFTAGTQDPIEYPGMASYLKDMEKYFPNTLPSEASLDGYLSADLFVKGLKMAGRNLTRTKLIDDINSLTSYTAGGALAPVNWKIAHFTSNIDCQAFVQVVNGQFINRFGSDGSVFTCFKSNLKNPTKVVLDNNVPGLPGAYISK
jgi:ABC-type branched-subunit amino acid transport system substrate-binding protein